MSDALKAYQFISDNAFSWIDTLRSLEGKIREREDHVNRVPAPGRSLKKSGSNESIRPRSHDKSLKLEVLSAPQNGDMTTETSGQHLLLQSRKRKTKSMVSSDSIPAKFRSRSMVIVYYDSEIQKTFEQVVRHIGTARNHLRRARTTLQMSSLVDGRDTSSFSTSLPSTKPLPAFQSSRTTPPTTDASMPNRASRNDSLVATDAALEKAQSLCERGAHQFLREGDCEAEILGAQESFEEAKRISDREMESSRQEMDETTSSEATGGTRKERLGPHLQGFLHNGTIEMDSDPDNDEEDDDLMKLARHQPRRTGGAPLSVPA